MNFFNLTEREIVIFINWFLIKNHSFLKSVTERKALTSSISHWKKSWLLSNEGGGGGGEECEFY